MSAAYYHQAQESHQRIATPCQRITEINLSDLQMNIYSANIVR